MRNPRRHHSIKVGGPLDLEEIEATIGRVYGMDIFESVSYDVMEEGGRTGVVVRPKEDSWGINSIQAGLELSADLEGDSCLNIRAAYTEMPINSINGECHTLLKLGEEPSLMTEIYQPLPLDPAECWFLNVAAGFDSSSVKLYEDRHANSAA